MLHVDIIEKVYYIGTYNQILYFNVIINKLNCYFKNNFGILNVNVTILYNT